MSGPGEATTVGGNSRLDAAATDPATVPRAAVGGAGQVTLYSAYGAPVRTVAPFAGYAGPVRAAVGDATGDGVPDLVAGTGPGVEAEVRLFDGATGAVVNSWRPFETGFAGGVYVATTDLNGDGRADVVVTPDDGGGPVVVTYDGAKLAAGTPGDRAQAARFYGLDDPNFRGGVRAAAGDLDGDGKAELVVAAGTGGGPRVSILDGSAAWGGVRRQVVGDFFAFAPDLRGGANVAVGDLGGDGYADLVLGAGAGGGPRVTALDGRVLTRDGSAAARARPIADFMAGDPESRAGVAVTAADAPGGAQVLTTPGTGGATRVTRITPAAVTPVAAVAAPTVPPPAPAPAPAADLGAAVLAFAQAHVGQVATDPAASGCAALAVAALRSAGADPNPTAAGPNPLHHSWGRPVYQRDESGAYARLGGLADVRPGDVLQLDGYSETRPDGSWVSAWHHTAIVESVDAATGRVAVLEQNAGGDPAVARGELHPESRTAGVVTAYRPAAG